MNTRLFLLATAFSIPSLVSHAQSTDSTTTPSPLRISGYVEAYYSYDFARPETHIRQPFLYSYNRHNTVNLNLGYVKAAYDNGRVRGTLALMAGTYANDNMAAEPGVLKNVFEANAGVKISRRKNVWIDAGILPSHIGWESAIGKDCPNLTRSLSADNTPYFETGARLSYTTDNGRWYMSGMILNGWQRIERVSGNNTPAFGHQLTFKPNSRVTLNSSSFIGSDKPDSNRRMRYFHDLYGQFAVSEKLSLTLGFDIGAEQNAKGSSDYHTWYSPNIIAYYKPTANWGIGLRGEYYNDPGGVIIGTGTPNGFQTLGYSVNLDRTITSNAVWRIEARGFNSKDAIFQQDGSPSQNNFFLTTALAVSF
ncbi:MAG: porin [Sphingobacteriales bacterium]|nr:MAG: porin [Sphingobacteriales bacterium]